MRDLGSAHLSDYQLEPFRTLVIVGSRRNIELCCNSKMALRWSAAGVQETQTTFRKLKAYRRLPVLRDALRDYIRRAKADGTIETIMKAT